MTGLVIISTGAWKNTQFYVNINASSIEEAKFAIENKIYNGIANIGRRPTVNDRGVLLEVNIFDFNNNIYGKEISVNLLNFIRKEKKFDGIESLKTQIKNDVRVSKEFFNLQ